MRKETQHEDEREYYESESIRRTVSIWLPTFTLHFNYGVILGRLKCVNMHAFGSVNVMENKGRDVEGLSTFFLSCCSFPADALF